MNKDLSLICELLFALVDKPVLNMLIIMIIFCLSKITGEK